MQPQRRGGAEEVRGELHLGVKTLPPRLFSAPPRLRGCIWFFEESMSLLIKNGRIITAADDYVADVFIDGETVAAIGKNLPMKADRTIDASNRLVISGGM